MYVLSLNGKLKNNGYPAQQNCVYTQFPNLYTHSLNEKNIPMTANVVMLMLLEFHDISKNIGHYIKY